MRGLLAGLAAAATFAAHPDGRPAAATAVQTMTPMSDAVKAELAPNGRLRAGLNYSNFLLVSSRAPDHAGVAPDLARELARRAGATVEFVGYGNAGLAADAAVTRAWDVAFIGAEPARADVITFSPACVEIEATYLVPEHSTIGAISDVDHESVRIVSTARAAYPVLQRTLRRRRWSKPTASPAPPPSSRRAATTRSPASRPGCARTCAPCPARASCRDVSPPCSRP
jgi:hypothetical protein